ncbi:adenylyl-sulfate kinase [Caenispirillum bisanense]|uniref:adenylyl-sulfate kinase n=1 Tax=Caenispirillum bisanense TaxID=414052 RepID=UPI0031E2F680
MSPRIKDAVPPLPIVIVGHVDHGKSTLIGRLLHETGSLPDGKLDELRAQSDRRGVDFEWSFVMDALQVERDQGITLDTTRIWLKTRKRPYVIIDAPGHKEFLRNMVTGAASADAAVLVVDAVQGLSEQTRRHAYLLSLLGVAQVIVAVNKMDRLDWAEAGFQAAAEAVTGYLAGIGITPLACVPLSAREGDNIVRPSTNLPWWQGPTLTQALDQVNARPQPVELPLRFPVQDVYRDGDRRILVGRIETGRLRVGDRIRFQPTGREASVAGFETWRGSTPIAASAGQSVAITLDDDLFVERGHVASHPGTAQHIGSRIQVRLFWLDREPLAAGDRVTVRLGTAAHAAVVDKVVQVVDVASLGASPAEQVHGGDVAEVILRSHGAMAFDTFADNPLTGRGVLVRGHRVAGGFVIEQAAAASPNVTAVAQSVEPAEVHRRNGHTGGVLWLTGLSGAGKSTLAMALRRRLFEAGWQVYTLDGDNLRHGLCGDLGFSDGDRSENIRRVAEVARLFADAGTLAIVSLISPRRADRAAARAIIGDGFREVHVDAPVSVCADRDPKGLYRKAYAGELPGFTGVSAPYEVPEQPDLVVPTGSLGLTESLDLLERQVIDAFGSQRRRNGRTG